MRAATPVFLMLLGGIFVTAIITTGLLNHSETNQTTPQQIQQTDTGQYKVLGHRKFEDDTRMHVFAKRVSDSPEPVLHVFVVEDEDKAPAIGDIVPVSRLGTRTMVLHDPPCRWN